jgi:hypothetical protein
MIVGSDGNLAWCFLLGGWIEVMRGDWEGVGWV